MSTTRNWPSLTAAAVAALLLAGTASAARRGAGAGAGTSPFSAQVTALREARALLEAADHDYKGHRAAAVKLVTAAIHALHPPKAGGSHAKAGGGKPAAAKPPVAGAKSSQGNAEGKANAIPQAVSDARLKQAMSQIAAIQGQLATSSNTAATSAAADLAKAVQELQTALSIK